jgi:hypothetical protein
MDREGAKGEEMPVPGKIELVLKINEFPKDVEIVTNGWKHFKIALSDGRFFSVTVRPAVFKKLEEARDKYPAWVAAIKGQIGSLEDDTFTLLQPAVSVFEYKPREAKPEETSSEAPKPNP